MVAVQFQQAGLHYRGQAHSVEQQAVQDFRMGGNTAH